jgi:hypothetical protein
MPKPPRRRAADHSDELKYRASRMVEHHPWWSGTIVGGLLPVLATALVGVASYAFGFIDTLPQAKEREQVMRKEIEAKIDDQKANLKNDVSGIYTQLGQVRSDLSVQVRQSAGMMQNALETRVLVARKWVNDCNILRQHKMTALEQNACFQYDADYAEAKRRYEAAANAAMQTWQQR